MTPEQHGSKTERIAELEQWRDGAVFRWAYKDAEPEDCRAYGIYHCCSRIGVVNKNGVLMDTYWYGTDNKTFTRGVAEKRLDLTFVANMEDLEKVSEGMECYYADEDIVDLNHANSTRGNFYIRRGAKRCAAKMRERAQQKLDEAIRAQKHANGRQEALTQTIAAIDAGVTDGLYI